MKFEINSIKFFKAINQVGKARNKNTLNQYLTNIYLKVEENSLIMRATNLEITCEKSTNIKGIVNGECLINGDILTKISGHFSSVDTNITCELVDGTFNISYLKNKLQLKTIDLEDFPNIPKAGQFLTSLNLKIYINLIKSVSFCAASTEIKPEISSVYLYSKNRELYSVATDSFRLAEKKVVFNSDSEDINILISQKNINEKISILEGILEDGDENIDLYNNENILTLQNDNISLAIRSINGNFPDYKQLFPKEFDTKIKVNKTELKNILNLSTIFVNNYSYIDFEVDNENKIIRSKSKNDKIGSLEKEINIIDGDGQNINASYNSNYFLDGLSHINNGEIELFFTTSNKPVFIKDANDESFTYLLMPLNK
ncbi:MAG: DNA polymerase III subunit beta [Candidatus Nomurabacteria bacterium]